MPLHHPHDLTERILLYGPLGTGKTSSYLKIAQWLQQTKSPNQVYVIDTDFALKRMLSKNEKYRNLTNLHYYECTKWDIVDDNNKEKNGRDKRRNKDGATGYVVPTTEKILSVIQPNDWFVVDFSDATWSMVQAWFTNKVYGKDIDDHFLLMRMEIQKTLKDGQKPKQSAAFSGRGDWPIINKIYFAWRDRILLQHDFNVVLTAKETDIEDDDKTKTKKLFRRFGVKPSGQKDMAHMMHTVLYTDKDDGHIITTVKDRENVYLDQEPISDFVLGYLVKVAGWKLK